MIQPDRYDRAHTHSSWSQFIVSTPMESNRGEAVEVTKDFWLGKDTSIGELTLSPLSGRRGAVADTGEQHGKYS